MEDNFLSSLEYNKGDIQLPVPRYQITSLRLFIEYCKYRKRAGDPIEDYQLLTKHELDLFNLDAPVTVTSPIPGSSTYPPTTSDPAMTEFNRGVKCDPNHFQAFINGRHWLDYKDHNIVTANSYNV